MREYTEEDVAGLNISSSFFDENGYIKDDQEPEWSSGVYVCVCVCVCDYHQHPPLLCARCGSKHGGGINTSNTSVLRATQSVDESSMWTRVQARRACDRGCRMQSTGSIHPRRYLYCCDAGLGV